ncbi:MAG: rhomboid family intramembrane serine protease, partial [Bacteroidales bacterium]
MNYFKQNSFLPPVTRNIIIINFLVWLASITLPSIFLKQFDIHFDPYNWLGLHYFQAKDFNAAQLFTYMFMHDPNGIGHVFFNMFSVFMFGRALEQFWGGKKFLFYYITTGIGAAIIQQIVWYFIISNYISH